MTATRTPCAPDPDTTARIRTACGYMSDRRIAQTLDVAEERVRQVRSAIPKTRGRSRRVTGAHKGDGSEAWHRRLAERQSRELLAAIVRIKPARAMR